jgi:ABC-type sugar transport system ATPase subunit
MTVADNIADGLRIRHMDKAEIDRRVRKVADMLELGNLVDRRPKRLPAASASGWPWAGPSSASPRCS